MRPGMVGGVEACCDVNPREKQVTKCAFTVRGGKFKYSRRKHAQGCMQSWVQTHPQQRRPPELGSSVIGYTETQLILILPQIHL